MNQHSHPPDSNLLRFIDGELTREQAAVIESHLVSCGRCRQRKQDFENASNNFARLRETELQPRIPPADVARELLRGRLAEAGSVHPAAPPVSWQAALAIAASIVLLSGITAAVLRSLGHRSAHEPSIALAVPNPRLTPGATVLVTSRDLCSSAETNNKTVPVALQRQVFDEYGIRRPAPMAYEVDYLITPALGGADDIRNLWPQSKAHTIWNAEVKDQLENRLRNLVCEGQVDLQTAQRELAGNWIEAYKKYFHTERPLEPR